VLATLKRWFARKLAPRGPEVGDAVRFEGKAYVVAIVDGGRGRTTFHRPIDEHARGWVSCATAELVWVQARAAWVLPGREG